MKKIPLTQGKFALVDDEDFEYLNQWKWCAHKSRYMFYADRGVLKNNKISTIKMHRVILGMKSSNRKLIDHINRDGLDNRKENLRVVNHSMNNYNRKKQKNNTSGFRGINWNNNINRWVCRIRKNGVSNYLGCFTNLKDAVRIYNNSAIKLYGENAILTTEGGHNVS